MATRATAIGKPLPICPYVLPRSDENTPSTARVVARPSENETALQRPQAPQLADWTGYLPVFAAADLAAFNQIINLSRVTHSLP